MDMGQFVTEQDTTKETVRYYIDEKLLSPEKVNKKYCFTELEERDFKNIRQLRDMGLSIKVIKLIKENKEYCGTRKQWEANVDLIDTELIRVESEIERLNQEKIALKQVKKQLKELLYREEAN
ncbi:MAG: MerR family transcriptional regulator [Vagococcus fluvialis]